MLEDTASGAGGGAVAVAVVVVAVAVAVAVVVVAVAVVVVVVVAAAEAATGAAKGAVTVSPAESARRPAPAIPPIRKGRLAWTRRGAEWCLRRIRPWARVRRTRRMVRVHVRSPSPTSPVHAAHVW